MEEVGHFLGHKHGSTTKVYAPDEPDLLWDVVDEIENMWNEVRPHLKVVDLDDSHATMEKLARVAAKHGKLRQARTAELHRLIEGGQKTPTQLAEQFGISLTAIYKHMKKLGKPARKKGACRDRAGQTSI